MVNIKYTNGICGGGEEWEKKRLENRLTVRNLVKRCGNIIKEIYYDGMREGYNLAKFRLELLNGVPPGVAEKYWDDNMENIRNVLSLCEQYEECE